MIGPKVPKPTPAEEKMAYRIAAGRDSSRCQRCLRDCGIGQISHDHRKDRSIGGQTRASNLQILGGTGTTGCHGWKTANPADAVAEGWSVPGFADPAKWPAARYISTQFGSVRKAWVLYDDEGGVREITQADAHELMGLAA